ncbi:STAS domain-containing protein [Nocardia sp. NPDC003963]
MQFRGDIVVLSMRGEADAFTLPLWRQALREAAAAADAGRGALIIDTTRLDFLSLSTLAALAADTDGHIAEMGEICLVTPNPRIASICSCDAYTSRLPLRSTLTGALTLFEQNKRRRFPSGPSRRYRVPQITAEDRAPIPEAQARHRT